MGLAVLPARLKQEIELMCSAISEGRDFSEIPEIRKHADWFAAIEAEHNVTSFNAEGIIKAEIGRTFVEVLRDAGVYKDTDEGRAAFLRFLGTVGGREV
jgi:UDPglucose--hexose-1-phosphate uridylyltransferase